METEEYLFEEEAKPGKLKKVLKIVLGIFATLLILAGIAFVLTQMKNARLVTENQTGMMESIPETAPLPKEKKVYTETEKLSILRSLSAPVVSVATTSHGGVNTVQMPAPVPVQPQTEKEKVLILQSLSAPVTASPPISDAEKFKILNSLSK